MKQCFRLDDRDAGAGTTWCLFCARVQLRTPATGTVDDDPACANCGPREAANSGCLFKGAAIVLPPVVVEPIQVTVAVTKTPRPSPAPKETSMPVSNRLTQQQKDAIRAAAPSVTDGELAKKYGVARNTILYHRNKTKGANTRTTNEGVLAGTVSAFPLSPAVSAAFRAFLDLMTEGVADQIWAVLPACDKVEALQRILAARVAG